jgi:hypothetical protein
VRKTTLVALFAAALASSGCHASAEANAKVASAAHDSDSEEHDEASAEPVSPIAGDQQSATPRAMLGARHDLRPATDKKTATCRCLSVVLGTPTDSSMAWQSLVPAIDPRTQLVIALSSDGIACSDAPKDSLGASYWGYRPAGDDVIVVVEAARQGRPITMGAIIPKPFGDGQVYIQPKMAAVPYGRALDGGARCKVGNPGPRRTTPLAPSERPEVSPAPDDTPEIDFTD